MFRDEVSEEYYCDKCETHVTEGSKHCRRCNRCAKNFDHHCIWLNNCIGYNNYTSFIVLIVLFWFQLAFQISLHATLLTLTLSWQTIVNHVCLVECGFIIVPLTYLVGYHFWLINKKLTTYAHIQLRKRKCSGHYISKALCNVPGVLDDNKTNNQQATELNEGNAD